MVPGTYKQRDSREPCQTCLCMASTTTATTIPVPKYKSITRSDIITLIQLPNPKLPGKRPTVDSLALDSTVESIKRPINDFRDGKIRTGHIGDTALKVDNGFFTKGFRLFKG